MAILNKIRVTAQALQKRFNERIPPRLDSGLYHLNLYSEKIPSAASNQIKGTKSVMYEVLDQHGQKVALAHIFVLPDGSYGGSGKLDPKEIRSGNTIYFL